MDCLCAEPDGAHLCLFIKAESERENGPFQGHPTSDCYKYNIKNYLFDFFSVLLKGVALGLYQRSWVQAGVKKCGWNSSLGRYCSSALIFPAA